MANEVIINIPGIGDVVAENAATEATLRDILAAIKSNGGTTGGGAGNTGGGSTSRSGGGAGGDKAFTDRVKNVANHMDRFGVSVIRSIDTFSRLNGSVTSAAGAVGDFANKIPLIGKTLEAAFDAVAGAQTNLIGSFQQASTSGAAFAGSLSLFTASASAASMNLQEYGKFVASNGEAMRALGVTTAAGAKRFAALSQALQSTSSELYGLGFTTGDINNGLASYAKLMQMSNNIRKKSDADLITGTKAYLKELDLVAKATGMTREQAADKMAEMNIDPQFSAFMDSLGPMGDDIRTTILANLNTLGPAAGKLLKDYLSTGGIPTTEEHAAISTAFGGTMAEANRINQMAIGGQLKTAEQADTAMKRLIDMLKLESSATTAQGGLANLNRFGDVGITLIQSMGNEIKKSQEAARQQAEHDQNKELLARERSIQDFIELQKAITEVGNSFTLVLSESGMLGVLKDAFNGMSSVIATTSVPLFKAFSMVMSSVTAKLSEWFKPFLSSLSDFSTYIPSILSTAFSPLGGFLKDKFGDVFDQVKDSTGEGFDAKKLAEKVTDWLGTGINYVVSGFRLLINIVEEVSTRFQLLMLSSATFEQSVLKMQLGLDRMSMIMNTFLQSTFAGMHIFGDDVAKNAEQAVKEARTDAIVHRSKLQDETDALEKTKGERSKKEQDLHDTIDKVNKQYKTIENDLKAWEEKLNNSISNIQQTSLTTADQASASIADQATAAGSSKISKGSKDYYNQVYSALLKSAKEKGVPNPEIIARLGAAQSVQETGWGSSVPPGSFNAFGMKGKGPAGSVEAWSPEEKNGVVSSKKSEFQKFHNFEESVSGYIDNLMKNEAYKGILAATTMPQAIAALGKSPYATSSIYSGKVASIDKSMQSQSSTSNGLNIKTGASAGGKVEEGTLALVQAVKAKLGGLMNRVTALNDTYHQEVNPTGGHAKGLKADITITKKEQSAYAAEAVRQVMAEHGIKDYIVNDEYAHPSAKATAGHLDIGFKRKVDAEKFANSYKSRQEEDRAKKDQQDVDREEQETQRVQQEEMQKQNAQNVQSSTDTHSQLMEQLLASFSELKQINADQLAAHERHISIAQAQSGNMYAG